MHLARTHKIWHKDDRKRLRFYSIALLWLSSLNYCTASSAAAQIDNPLKNLPVADIAAAYNGEQLYEITRDGKSIGTHLVTFQSEDNRLTVTVDSSIVVRVLRIPVYRLSYVAEEVWIDNQLVTVKATTIENGDTNTVALDNSTATGVMSGFSTNHWHPGVLESDTVFNTLTGEVENVSVSVAGEDTITVVNKQVSATKYVYSGSIDADVWYDADGRWLALAFEGDDGSKIQYLRKR